MCDSCEFEMPFGKYKNEELGVLRISDWDYLVWTSQNFDDGEVLDAIEEVLENHEPL